jgi:opacity protein-like surface antigen
MKKTLFAMLAGFLAIGAAQAQATAYTPVDTAPHVYVGVGFGAVKNSFTGDRQRTTKLFGGYEFNQNWGLEAGYSYLGKTDMYFVEGNALVRDQMKSENTYLAAKYTMPLSERSSVYGKLGWSHTERGGLRHGGYPWLGSDDGLYAAAGLQYKLTGKVSMYAEYERYGEPRPNGPKNSVLNAGLKVGF